MEANYIKQRENSRLVLKISYGSRQAKKCLRKCTKCADSDHPASAQSIIRAFTLHLYTLYLVILFADSEGSDQTGSTVNIIRRYRQSAASTRTDISMGARIPFAGTIF